MWARVPLNYLHDLHETWWQFITSAKEEPKILWSGSQLLIEINDYCSGIRVKWAKISEYVEQRAFKFLPPTGQKMKKVIFFIFSNKTTFKWLKIVIFSHNSCCSFILRWKKACSYLNLKVDFFLSYNTKFLFLSQNAFKSLHCLLGSAQMQKSRLQKLSE